MSSLWTPGGEHRVPPDSRSPEGTEPGNAPPPPSRSAPPHDDSAHRHGPALDDDDAAALAEIRGQLLQAPAEVVVANHVYGLFELAALHLSSERPNMEAARLAIDAMAAVVDGLAGRLGDGEPELRQGLANLRMAFVQVQQELGTQT